MLPDRSIRHLISVWKGKKKKKKKIRLHDFYLFLLLSFFFPPCSCCYPSLFASPIHFDTALTSPSFISHFIRPNCLFVFSFPIRNWICQMRQRTAAILWKKQNAVTVHFISPPLAFLSLLDVREDYVIIDPIIKCLDSYRPVRHGKEGYREERPLTCTNQSGRRLFFFREDEAKDTTLLSS